MLAVCNKNDIPLIPDSILKNIYDKTNSAKINGVNNPYLHRGATVGNVQSREEWRNRKKIFPHSRVVYLNLIIKKFTTQI